MTATRLHPPCSRTKEDSMQLRLYLAKLFPTALLFVLCGVLAACGGSASDNPCVVTAIIKPVTATADHTVVAPGNQVQFSTSLTTSGSCALPQNIVLGSWSTSDPTDITISSQQPTQALATCVNATTSPATVSYSGTQFGYSFAPATLTCK